MWGDSRNCRCCRYGSVVEVSGALGTSFHAGQMVLSRVDPHGLSPVNK